MQGISSGKNAPPPPKMANTELSGAAIGENGLLSDQKDAKKSAKESKLGDTWTQMQAKYGAKADKPREIKKTLGKDDFLKIMITQMKNQDPTQPFKAEQFATQLAQFTSVEQMQNMNQSLTKMTTANAPLERLAMTNMIGKTITIDRERFPHTEGQNEALNVPLTKDAKQVNVKIISDSGETVFEKNLGPTKQGETTFAWDGLKSNTLPSKTGTYIFKVEAKDEQGNEIPMSTQSQSRVMGVSYEGSEAVFLIGDLNNPQKVTMRNVIRIDGDGGGAVVPGAKPISGGVVPPAGKKQNLFTFEKGKGSANLDPSSVSPETLQAIARAQAGGAQAEAVASNSQVNGASNSQAYSQASQLANAANAAQAENRHADNSHENSLKQGQNSKINSTNPEKGFANGLNSGNDN
ncbi:MAG: flagellar hook assembly protein FlgD [Methylotenera sp.]|nr:flagellar hook assembly protein FlgD [Oligoflexia bacterium]